MNKPWKCPECGVWNAWWVNQHKCDRGIVPTETGDQVSDNKICKHCGDTISIASDGHWCGDNSCNCMSESGLGVGHEPLEGDTVTITISRKDAEGFYDAYWDPDKDCDCAGCQIVPVIRAALKDTVTITIKRFRDSIARSREWWASQERQEGFQLGVSVDPDRLESVLDELERLRSSDPDTVTIRLRASDADFMATDEWADERLARIANACRAALKETE